MSSQLHLTGRSPRDKYVTCSGGTLASACAKHLADWASHPANQGEQSDGVSLFYHFNEGTLVEILRSSVYLSDSKHFTAPPHTPYICAHYLKSKLLLYPQFAEHRALVRREEQQGYHKRILRVGMSDYRTTLGSIVFSAKGALVSLGVLTSYITSTINHINRTEL